MNVSFKIVYTDSNGWCNPCFFPYGEERFSPLAGRKIRGRLIPGVAKVTFPRLPRKGWAVIGTASGALYSEAFVNSVKQLGLSGVRFHPTEVSTRGKTPEGPWFWGEPLSLLPIDERLYAGELHEVCPVTGHLQKISKEPGNAPQKLRFRQLPVTDFFGVSNVSASAMCISGSAVEALRRSGVGKFDLAEVEV